MAFLLFLTVPPGPPFPENFHLKKMCGVIWTYTGPLEKAEEVFKPIRAFKKPAVDLLGPLPLPALQGLFDGLYPTGLQWYWRSDFVNEINDTAIASHIRFASTLPTMHSSMHLYPVNGAAARINKSDTTWNYRDALFSMVIIGVDPDPVNKDKDFNLGKTILGSPASVFSWWSLSEFYRGGRGRSSEILLWRKL